ncbi:MAG: hypothetical protein MJ154_00670 [Candidatus Saccharibacteria bacterium]|nr:hypothetical protein [Candidatus Saccharibacteria bacterium]
MSRRIFYILLICITCLLAALTPTAVKADDAWISGDYGGGGGGGGGGGSGGGGSTTCEPATPSLECSGVSWIFYQYTGGAANISNAGIRFPENTTTSDSRLPEISQKCATYGEGTGFWHFGRNAMAKGALWNASIVMTSNGSYRSVSAPALTTSYLWSSTKKSYIHFATTSNKTITDKYSWYKGSRNQTSFYYPAEDKTYYYSPHHILYKNNVELYSAARYATHTGGTAGTTTDNVYKAFREAYKAARGVDLPENGSMENEGAGLYAFCWGKDMNGGVTFSGKVTVTANGKNNGGDSVEVTSDTFDLKADHYIARGDDIYNKSASSSWSYSGDAGSGSGKKDFPTKNSGDQFVATGRNTSKQSPAPGETKTYCSTLTYTGSIDGNGNPGANASVQGCVKVYRKPVTSSAFTAKVSCYGHAGSNSTNACGQTVNTNSKEWTITNHGWVDSSTGNIGGHINVGASSVGGGHLWSHSAPQSGFGVSGSCIHSDRLYTSYSYTADQNKISPGPSSGLTLKSTGTPDMPDEGGHPGDKNLHHDGTYYWQCNSYGWKDVGSGNGTHAVDKNGAITETAGGNLRWDCLSGEWKPHMVLWFEGCENDSTNLHTYDNAYKTSDWNQNDDARLKLLGNNEHVDVQKCSTMQATSNYSNGSWTDSNSKTGCTTIRRWRRHVNFEKEESVIKADPGPTATTKRDNNSTLNVSSTNGKFTIKFTYSLKRTNTINAYDTGAENIEVTNYWKSKETAFAMDGSNHVYAVNGTFNAIHDYGEFTSNQANKSAVAGTKTETVTGTLHYGQKVKICSNLYYGSRVKETDDGSAVETNGGGEAGCITITRDEADCGNVVSSNSESFHFSHQKGDNVAKIGVMNKTTGMNSMLYTNWSYDQGNINAVGIWARPGDLIKYRIEYCMAANYGHVVQTADNINTHAGNTDAIMSGDSAGRTTNDTNKVSADKRSNYLFGDSVSSYDGTKTTAVPMHFTIYSNNHLNVDASLAGIIGYKVSPGASMDNYGCPVGDGTAINTIGYYQIAGKVKHNTNKWDADNYVIDGCNSNRTQSLDVGRELSEKLTWSNIRITGIGSSVTRDNYASTAYVRVPYNYTAKPYIKNLSLPKGTVQVGGKMSTQPGIAVFPRKNCALTKDFLTQHKCAGDESLATYATVTKPTTVRYVTYVNSKSHIIKDESIIVRANTKSNPNGSKADGVFSSGNLDAGGPNMDSQYIIEVPNDAEPGDKICIEMTITPADSHNTTKTSVMGASINYTAAENRNDSNKVFWGLREGMEGLEQYEQTSATAVSCSTVVKRPTISIEDSNLYTATSVATSVISRKNGDNYYLYGSWSEYGIFGRVLTGSSQDSVSTLMTGSGASLGYNQTSYRAAHNRTITGYNAQPLLVVKYNGGPNNGIHNYHYNKISAAATQTYIEYDYTVKEDGSHEYKLKTRQNKSIAPSSYVYTNVPTANAGNAVGSAGQNTTICVHSTQTFANTNCDDGTIGANGIGEDAAEVFSDNILDRYSVSKLSKTTTTNATTYSSGANTYVDLVNNRTPISKFGNEGSILYKYVDSNAFIGYTNGSDFDLSSYNIETNSNVEGLATTSPVGSTIVYRAKNVVINSSIIANSDQKHGLNDFKMPIIIADSVWLTGNPTQIDAIIITNELNTCKWNTYNDFLNNKQATIKAGSNGVNLNKNTCTKPVRFTAPVIVKGKVILNRTYGAGSGEDQARRAEIFELNAATYLWTFNEMSRYNQATTTFSRELPSRY